MSGIFERAAREKLRFGSHYGVIGVEDLWDLQVERLDEIYKPLNRQRRTQNEDSLLDMPHVNERLELQVEIVKHIVAVKLTEAQEREQAAERRMRKERLLSILADKQDEELRGMSLEELQAEIEALTD